MKNKWLRAALLALPLAAAGLADGPVDANASDQQRSTTYVCPATGEQLPCPNCCPLKKP